MEGAPQMSPSSNNEMEPRPLTQSVFEDIERDIESYGPEILDTKYADLKESYKLTEEGKLGTVADDDVRKPLNNLGRVAGGVEPRSPGSSGAKVNERIMRDPETLGNSGDDSGMAAGAGM